MPDVNKFEALRAAQYEIPRCCALCHGGDFPSANSPWGDCTRVTYAHVKHTGPARGVSIVRWGVCKHFLPDAGRRIALGAHLEFFKEQP